MEPLSMMIASPVRVGGDRRQSALHPSQQPPQHKHRDVLYGRTEHVGKGGGGNAVMEMGLEKADAHSASSLAASPGIVAGGPCANASGPVRHRPRSPRCYTPVPRRAGLAGGLRLCRWHALVAAFAGSYIRVAACSARCATPALAVRGGGHVRLA